MVTVVKNFEMQPETPDWECVLESKPGIGEVPIWSIEEDSIYWIDVYAGLLNRSDLKTRQTQTWSTPETIGSYALIEGEAAALVALQSGIYRLDFESGKIDKRFDAPYDPEKFRFNDGRCDRQGRFWVGNMPLRHREGPFPVGESAFWWPDGAELRFGVGKMTIANGIAFSVSGDRLYLADAPTSSVVLFDYDNETGKATNRRTFATVPESMSLDGATVDTEDNYWIASPKNGCILKFTPDGAIDRIIKAPTLKPAMVCFGGPDLRSLYVTTMTRNYPSQEALHSEPLAGGIFKLDVGAQGVPEPKVRI
jgi:L-arabinonolactonase